MRSGGSRQLHTQLSHTMAVDQTRVSSQLGMSAKPRSSQLSPTKPSATASTNDELKIEQVTPEQAAQIIKKYILPMF